MFEDFRRAWREAVTNFWAEVRADDDADASVAYRQVARARTQLDELDAGIADATRRMKEEREQAAVCRRRERMAEAIGDRETAGVAARYGARHLERAAVLERKVEALEAERRLCRRDLTEMERVLQEGRMSGPASVLEELDRDPAEADFRNLEDASRDRAAAERLADLKRRMGR